MRVTKVQPGDTVLLRGQHAWAGETAVVVARNQAGVIVARLTDGHETQAWPTQYARWSPA